MTYVLVAEILRTATSRQFVNIAEGLKIDQSTQNMSPYVKVYVNTCIYYKKYCCAVTTSKHNILPQHDASIHS